MEVRDKVAIVTGAAGGIGEALTHRFLEAGARVLVSDIDVDKLHATAGRLERVAGAGTVDCFVSHPPLYCTPWN